MVLSKIEFVRRFEQHILPKGFVKMRHYGILGNFKRKQRINRILQKMGLPEHPPTTKVPFFIRMMEKFGCDIRQCQHCKKGQLKLMEKVYPRNRGSPLHATWSELTHFAAKMRRKHQKEGRFDYFSGCEKHKLLIINICKFKKAL